MVDTTSLTVPFGGILGAQQVPNPNYIPPTTGPSTFLGNLVTGNISLVNGLNDILASSNSFLGGVVGALNNTKNYLNTNAQAFELSKKVRIIPEATLNNYQNANASSVTFDVSPEFNESGSATYVEINDGTRLPGSMFLYTGSPSRTFTITAKLVSRTSNEATINFKKLHIMKSWRQPDKTFKGPLSDLGVPRTLRLYGYGSNLYGIPTIAKSFNYDFPVDCDYIPTLDGAAMMPIIFSISLTLSEVRAPVELTAEFDIDKYAQGMLPGW